MVLLLHLRKISKSNKLLKTANLRNLFWEVYIHRSLYGPADELLCTSIWRKSTKYRTYRSSNNKGSTENLPSFVWESRIKYSNIGYLENGFSPLSEYLPLPSKTLISDGPSRAYRNYNIHRVPECSLRRNWVPPIPSPRKRVSLPSWTRGGTHAFVWEDPKTESLAFCIRVQRLYIFKKNDRGSRLYSIGVKSYSETLL